MAAQVGHVRAAALLIDSKCNIDAADELGLTALLAATIGGHAEVVAMLLARGASIGVATQESFSLVDVARAEGYHDVVDAITSSPGYVPFKSAPFTRPSERP
jgi:ankyrin repeat protein